MLVCSENQVAGGQIVKEIGRISATSGWCGKAGDPGQRNRALARLIAAAQDFEADAIISVNYEIDGVITQDLTSQPLERVQVSGIAVKLARAA